MGGRGASSSSGGGGSLQSHFDAENKRIAEFMQGSRSGSIEMENGQTLERYTLDYMKNYILKDAKSGGVMWEDDQISILYKDGKIESYIEGDDTSGMKLSNIEGVIYSNSATTAYAGKGVEIVNYKELFPKDYPHEKGYEDDWRIDFE